MHRTPLQIAAAAILTGCASAEPAPDVASPAPGPPSRRAVEPPIDRRELRVCVVEGGELREVVAMYEPATGDTIFSAETRMHDLDRHPAYARAHSWFWNDTPISVGRKQYVKHGLPRTFAPGELAHFGEWGGVQLFETPEQRDKLRPSGAHNLDFYLPVGPTCLFQRYTDTGYYGPVRG